MFNQKLTSQDSDSPLHSLKKYVANILKAYKDDNNNVKYSTTFFNYIRNVPIEDDEIIISFDVTSIYINIPIIDTLIIIKDYVNNDDQFTKKMTIYQDKFFDLVNLVLTSTCHIFNYQFYQETDGVAMGESAFSTTAEIYMKAHYLRHYTLQKSGNDLLMTFIPFLNLRTWKTFYITLTIIMKILS